MFSRINGAGMACRAWAMFCCSVRTAARVNGRQVPDVHPASAGESDVLAPPGRCQAINQAGKLFQVSRIESFGAPEGKVQAVRNEDKVFTQQVEFAKLFRRGIKIVVGRDFE